jgi:putative DNA-invertase from lambdoid prophage Rac
MTPAAIFARVSKKDAQDTENQLVQLRRWAAGRGFEVVAEYVLEESAYTGAQRRQLEQVIRDGRRGRFQVLLVWALDRLSREGAEAILALVRRLHEAGVRGGAAAT